MTSYSDYVFLSLLFVFVQDNKKEYFLYVSIVDGGVYDYSPLEVLVVDVDLFRCKIIFFFLQLWVSVGRLLKRQGKKPWFLLFETLYKLCLKIQISHQKKQGI